jgi:hypothetical protein
MEEEFFAALVALNTVAVPIYSGILYHPNTFVSIIKIDKNELIN